MTRILQIAKFYPPVRGGIEQVVELYAGGLAEAGYEVDVLAYAADGFDRVETPRAGLTITRIDPMISLYGGQLSFRYVAAVRRLAKMADIIHVHEPNPLATVSALACARDKPLYVSWHADIFRQRAVLALLKPFQRALCQRATSIIVSSESLRRNSYLLPEFFEKCTVVPFGLDLRKFEAAADDVSQIAVTRERWGGRFVLAVGRLAHYKGFDVLLRALAGTGVRAIIVGDGPNRAQLDALRTSLGLDPRVKLPGPADDAELIRLYAACEFFVLPSTNTAEAFGVVQMEAMACGKAVINTQLDSGVPEVSLHGLTGLTVAPGDPLDLRTAILTLWNEPELRATYGRAARQRASAVFGRKRVIQQLVKLYNN